MTHFLVIREYEDPDHPGFMERDWEIEHQLDCPQAVQYLHPSGVPITDHTCAVGAEINQCGLDTLSEDWKTLRPGRYEIEHWFEPGKWYGANWSDPDGGLQIMERTR